MPVTRLAVLLAVVFAGAPAAGAAEVLSAGVDGTQTIWLRAGGAEVVHLDPGEYAVDVDDRSRQHNFRLSGPGVERATDVLAIERVVWDVAFVPGIYRYWCDQHGQMSGRFTVGDVIVISGAGLGFGRVVSEPAGVNWPWTIGAAFPAGAQVTLSATPDPGYVFQGWQGGGCTGKEPCTVTVAGRTEIQATFGRPLAPGGDGGSTVTAPARLVSLSVVRTRQGRVVKAALDVRRETSVRAQLRRSGRLVASTTARLSPGSRAVRIRVPRTAKAGSYTVRLGLRDIASGEVFTVRRTLRLPRP